MAVGMQDLAPDLVELLEVHIDHSSSLTVVKKLGGFEISS